MRLNLSEQLQSGIFDRTPAIRIGGGAPRVARRLLAAIDQADHTRCGISVRLTDGAHLALDLCFNVAPEHPNDPSACLTAMASTIVERLLPSLPRNLATAPRKVIALVVIAPPSRLPRPMAFGPVDSAIELRIVIDPQSDQFVVVDNDSSFSSNL